MPSWFSFIELITGFSTIFLSICFLLLINFALDWLPSRKFLILLLAAAIALKTSLFGLELFKNALSYAVFQLTFPLILLLGPTLTGFTQSTLLMEQRPLLDRRTRQLVLSGYLLTLPVLFVVFLQPGEFFKTVSNSGMTVFILVFVATSSWHFLPVLWRLSRGELYSVGCGENTYHWLRSIWLSMSAIWLMLVFETISHEFFGYASAWHSALFAVFDLLIWMALLFYTVAYCRKPNKDEEREHCDSSQKYKKSALSSTRANKILDAVDELMKSQQLFLENDITLDNLATLVKTQPQYLSQAINQYREVNFYEFIAQYRIEFAKQELRNSPGKSVLDIAMSAGFNAKSTFNLTFKKITGLTPSGYRKQQLI